MTLEAEKVNESILGLHGSEIGSKAKTTIYECVIREAMSSGRAATPLRAVKRTCAPTKSQSLKKKKKKREKIRKSKQRHTCDNLKSKASKTTQKSTKLSATSQDRQQNYLV